MSNLLEIKDLVVDYGIIRALKGIHLKVPKGSIVAIIGANGAGKTTTIRTINGVVKPKSGEILLEGKNIVGMEPYRLASLGMIQSPEGRLILRGLTVEENLLIGAYSVKQNSLIKQSLEEVYTYFPVLKERRLQQASTLSGGEQQMLAIGRALMGRPNILLLDEPSLGLAPLIVQEIFRIIEKIKEQGTAILIVEQNAYQTLKIADYVYVLELGKVKTEGKASDLLKDDQLVQAYLGISK
ncbi:MAG: ABC transporter ATP-binding protein [Tenericutes bacterium HGW-Tenericutes-6]|jgi:branched-chain amino acid transport system ATP-binding protein|nr:MAG: ABC transporter ATP-binding protein [Tenericutes bacterium HGW-Tenericutes-7]PKK93163.1 MAG: ABC transporter ATP-binding protein [Tenericutes bacterium HGW-Tenericutes-6]